MSEFLRQFLYEPALLVPGQKPVGPLKLKARHPFSTHDAFALPFLRGSEDRDLNGKRYTITDAKMRSEALWFDSVVTTQGVNLDSLAGTINWNNSTIICSFISNRTGSTGRDTYFSIVKDNSERIYLERNTFDTYLRFTHIDNWTNTTLATASGSLPYNDRTVHHCVVCLNNGNLKLFLDGIEQNSDTVTTGLSGLDESGLGYLANGSGGRSNPLDGAISLFAVSSAALPEGVCRELSIDPWQVLESANDSVYLSSVPVSGGQTINVGQAFESNTANSVTAVKTITQVVGQASETNTSQSVTPLKAITQAVGQAAEANTSQTITPLKTIKQSVGQASESDISNAVTAVKTIYESTGQAAETDAAFAITNASQTVVAVNQASETNTSRSITAEKTINVSVGLASESDAAFTITTLGSTPVGLASELDTAQPITIRKDVAVGLAAETNSAYSISPVTGTTLGLAQETDTARSITPRKIVDVGISAETDTAFGMTSGQVGVLGLAIETDLARSISVLRRVSVGLATETDLARTIFDPNAQMSPEQIAKILQSKESAEITSGKRSAIVTRP